MEMNKLNSAIASAEHNREDVNLHAAERGRHLARRIKTCADIVSQIRDCKQLNKQMNRNNLSTFSVDRIHTQLVKKLKEHQAVVVQLRIMYSEMCTQYRKEREICDALIELKSIKEK